MKHIFDWIIKSHEWAFSGFLVTLPVAFITFVWGWFVAYFKNRPEAIGYEIFGPWSFPIPLEILTENSKSDKKTVADITISALRIDNYSNKSQNNVRILYTGGYGYPARLEFARRDARVEYEIKADSKEISINEIPPNESVDVAFFDPNNAFSVAQILIGNDEITHSMRKRAESKRYPDFARTQRIVVVTVSIALFLGLVVTPYSIWKKSNEEKIIDAATDGLRGCPAKVIYDSDEDIDGLNQQFLALSPPYADMVLRLNKVFSLSELDKKKTVVMLECEPQ